MNQIEDVSTLKEYGFAHAAVNHHHQHGVIDSSMSSPISIGKFYTEEDFKKAVTKEANSIKKADKKTSKTGGKGKDSTSFCFIHGLNRHAGSDCRMLLPYKSVFPRLLTESNTTATHFGFTSSNEGLPKKQQARFLSALAEQFMAKKWERGDIGHAYNLTNNSTINTIVDDEQHDNNDNFSDASYYS